MLDELKKVVIQQTSRQMIPIAKSVSSVSALKERLLVTSQTTPRHNFKIQQTDKDMFGAGMTPKSSEKTPRVSSRSSGQRASSLKELHLSELCKPI